MSYDDNGNLIIDENDNLIYNKNNKLVQFNNIVYEYNPLGQRIIEGDNKNIYSEEGNLIHVNNPNYTIDYIYFNDIKISMVKDDFIDYNVYFAHNNYIGLPKVFTDINQNIAWKGIFKPFGELFEETGNINNNIRYIGQYANIENEYFYNYHRDYDPTIGRYIQSDPIGLNGGMNTYAYALSNPINYTDKFGLDITIENVKSKRPVVENFHLNVGVKGKKRYTFAISDTYLNGDELIFGGGYAGLTGTFKDGIIKLDTLDFREENKILISNEVLDNNIERLLESLLGKKGDYALFTNSCRNFSKEVFEFASENRDILEKYNFSSTEVLDMYKKYYLK